MYKNQITLLGTSACPIDPHDEKIRNYIAEIFPYALASEEIDEIEEGLDIIANTASCLSLKERKNLRRNKEDLVKRIATLSSFGVQFETVCDFADDPRFVKKVFSDSMEEAMSFVRDEFSLNYTSTDIDEKEYTDFDEKAIA